jgi:hypothetical protein
LFLFDLGGGVDPADYEAWAETVDLPQLRALPSVHSYRILRAAPARGPQAVAAATDGPPRYIEIIDVASAEEFSQDMAQPGSGEVAAAFRPLRGHADGAHLHRTRFHRTRFPTRRTATERRLTDPVTRKECR